MGSGAGAPASRWSELRYDRLLPVAARSRAAGRAYARLVAALETAGDRQRRDAAIARIARWQGASRVEAKRIFRASLASEALEEADSAYFMRRDRDALLRWFPDRGAIPALAGPTIYATLHFGHPVLSYAYLRHACGADLRVIVRGLDAANPMAGAKRRWGERKLRWLHGFAGVESLWTDGGSIARAREHLLERGPLFAAVDVPGEAVARSTAVCMRGERVAFSSGVTSLARMTGAALQPFVAISAPDRMRIHFGRRIDPAEPDPTAALFAELEAFVHRFPEEWWLWPYVTPA